MENSTLTTYIITGGKSSRMGSDKATSLFKNETFLTHIVKALKPLKTVIKLVSSLPQHQNLGYELICDIAIDKGPICGITSALSNTNTCNNLIVSCDVPLISFDLIDWLTKQHNNDYDATVVCVDSKKMPLVGIYSKSCISVFKNHLEENKLKLMHALSNLNINYIEVPKKWSKQLANINTQEELKLIEQ